MAFAVSNAVSNYSLFKGSESIKFQILNFELSDQFKIQN